MVITFTAFLIKGHESALSFLKKVSMWENCQLCFSCDCSDQMAFSCKDELKVTILRVFIYLSTIQMQVKHNAAWGKATKPVTQLTQLYIRYL